MFPLVICGFRSRVLKRYFEAGDPSGLSVPKVARVGRMLRALDAATRPEQLNLPGFHWRITFGWDGADMVAVDLEDDH